MSVVDAGAAATARQLRLPHDGEQQDVAGTIRVACSMTSGTPAVSATSVSHTISARRFCAAITVAAARA